MSLNKRSMMSRCVRTMLLLTIMSAGIIVTHGAEVGKITIEALSQELRQDVLEVLVRQTIATRVGGEFSASTVSEDIKLLIKTGRFDDVRTSFVTEADGKVTVKFIIAPKPIVRNVYLQGNGEYSASKLKKLIELEVGKQLDENQLAKDRKALLDKYHNAGYYGTEVSTVRSKPESGAGVNITYVIREQSRVKLKKVYFQNNTAYTEDELRSAIVTRRQWWRYIFRLGNYFNEQQLVLDKDKLIDMYGRKGYMDFSVSEIKQEKLDDGKWVVVTFVLDEGTPYVIGNVSLSGSERFKAEELLAKATAKSGDVHSSERERLDINLMKAEYERLGYMDLRFIPFHRKDTAKHVVDVEYRVSEGRPSNIRNIAITGNEITKDEVIRRELAIGPGDLGDSGKVRASRNRLMNLGYFESVDILPVSTETPDLKDLRIELKEKPTGSVSLGAGFSSEDSAIGFVEFTETNFDLARLFNWPPKGDGQRLRARLQIGSEVSNIAVTHTEPWFLDRRLELTTDFFLRNRYEDEYDQRNIGMGMMLSWPVSFRIPGTEHIENWRVGMGFRVESVKIFDVDEHDEMKAMEEGDFVRDHVLLDEEDSYVANRLIARLTRDTRNSFQYPTRGTLVSLQTELVTSAMGSYETYGRFDLGYTKYIPFVRDLVLKLDANYYTTTGDKAAIFDRYFGGGIGTIRGFRRRDVSPVDCYEDPLGGNSMLTGTIEIIKPVKDFMFVSTFLDAGNAWWDNFEMDLGDLNYSVGVGVQFRALPISIYYGVPISTTYDHLEGKSGRLHFNIGLSY